MKKAIHVSTLLCFSAFVCSQTASSVNIENRPAYTELTSDITDNSNLLQQISDELNNLGTALGFTIRAAQSTTTPSSSLLNLNQTVTNEFAVVQDLFAALSINYNYINTNAFIANPIYNNINQMANLVFNENSTSSTSSSSSSSSQSQTSSTNNLNSGTTVNSPVAQLLQNVLSVTPDSYCFVTRPNTSSDCTSQDWVSSCQFKYTQSKIFANAWGFYTQGGSTIDDLFSTQQSASGKCQITFSPGSDGGSNTQLNTLAGMVYKNVNPGQLFFPANDQNYNQLLLNQLDSSLLTSPLLYDQTSSNSQTTTQAYGLVTGNAEQAAENYIQYVTGNVLPPDPISQTDLQTLSQNIYNASDISAQLSSFRELSKYILGLRVYAARVSVGIQNIYEILGSRKQIPNDNNTDQSQATSQALNEFKMATYRLYNPSANPNNISSSTDTQDQPWQQMINNASPATVQKETAILLAEINYQLYLMRKQQEKILLTNSVMLLQGAMPPTANIPDSNSTSNDQS